MKELKYSIIAEIKKTDKSKVYLASMEDLKFPVVVKEIQHGNVQVFRALMNMDNEHLPKIYHVKENGNGLTIVEEYIEGEVLSEYISKGNLTEEQCIDYAKQLCDVLKVLHSHRPALIHRDIKPSNMIINSKGILKLIDFDSSRLYKDESETDTRLLGTEHYAPPEQYGYSQTDCRSDIYSVGVVLEKFTSFISEGNQKKWKHIVEKCTLFSPDSRFQNVDELATRIRNLKNKFGLLFFVGVGILIIGLVVGCLCICNKKPEDTDAPILTESDTPGLTEQDTTIAKVTEPDTTTVPNFDFTIDYKTISPEWRDISTDSQAIVDLKTEIRRNGMVVKYLFKDRMREKDYFIQEKEFDNTDIKCVGVNLYYVEEERVEQVDDQYWKVEDGIVIISYEYMNNIEDGYYRIAPVLMSSDGSKRESNCVLYVSERDQLQEPDQWIQNTSFELDGREKIHFVVRNDSYNKIASIHDYDGYELDPSLYRIIQDGRAIEISKELVASMSKGEEWSYCLVGNDGREQWVGIKH